MNSAFKNSSILDVALVKKLPKTIDAKTGAFSIQDLIGTILEESRCLVQNISAEAAADLVLKIKKAGSIFCFAQGRSGFVLRCFCMRLMHLGYRVYFCGETITPAIFRGDLLIVLSGSGETPATLAAVSSAKEHHAVTCGILGNLESAIAALVDMSIHLPGTTKLCRDHEPDSSQMAGSLFEQAAFLFLEALILNLYQENDRGVGPLSPRHAVIE
jgi:6-phospho-3-hexuloisomerase